MNGTRDWLAYLVLCMVSIGFAAYAIDLKYFPPAPHVIPPPRRVISHTDSDHFEPECATHDSIVDYLHEQKCRIDSLAEQKRLNLERTNCVKIPKVK